MREPDLSRRHIVIGLACATIVLLTWSVTFERNAVRPLPLRDLSRLPSLETSTNASDSTSGGDAENDDNAPPAQNPAQNASVLVPDVSIQNNNCSIAGSSRPRP